jgi:hypothetical protein
VSNYTITCDRCKLPIQHICNEEFKEALTSLLTWVPEGAWSSPQMAKAFTAESKRQGNEHQFDKYPFYGSQAWTYLIWHKEDARTFHALLNNLIRAIGIDPHELESQLLSQIEAKANK